MPVLYELLSWLRNELPILLQRLACVPTPQPEAPEEEAEPDAETLQGEAAPKLRGEAYARHCAQSARHRGAMELAAQREREEAEEEERRLRWEKVRSIIKAEEEAARAKAKALVGEETTSVTASSPTPLALSPPLAASDARTCAQAGEAAAAAAAPGARGGGRNGSARGGAGSGSARGAMGRGRVGRGRGDVMWPEFQRPHATPVDALQKSSAQQEGGRNSGGDESASAVIVADGGGVNLAHPPGLTSLPPPPPASQLPPRPQPPSEDASAEPPPPASLAAEEEEVLMDPSGPHHLPRPSASDLAPPPLTDAQENEGRAVLSARDSKRRSAEGRKMIESRARLPAASKEAAVLEALRQSSVLVVSGETGCGKTTQVPQFILDEAISAGRGGAVNIICTQPRRISAMGVATRVAAERCEPLGHTVGYQIRLESKRSAPHPAALLHDWSAAPPAAWRPNARRSDARHSGRGA